MSILSLLLSNYITQIKLIFKKLSHFFLESTTEDSYWRPSFNWIGWLTIFAVVLASIFIMLAYQFIQLKTFHSQQEYPEFVVGTITWIASNKSIDYHILMYSIVIFLGAILFFDSIYKLFIKRCGKTITNHLNTLFACTLIPAIWSLLIHLSGSSHALDLLFLSIFFILLTSICLIALLNYKHQFIPQEIYDICGGSLLVIIFSVFDVLALLTTLGRVSIAVHQKILLIQHGLEYRLLAIIFVLSFLSILTILVFSQTIFNARRRLLNLLLIIQYPLPLLIYIFLPPFWQIANKLVVGYPYTIGLPLLLTLFIMICLLDLRKKYRYFNVNLLNNLENWTLSRSLSTITIACVILYICYLFYSSLNGLPTITNDYEDGKAFLAWQQLFNFHKLPYVDYNYPHGLMDLALGGVMHLFFNDTAAAIMPSKTLFNGILLVIFFISLAELTDVLLASLITLSAGAALFSAPNWLAPLTLVFLFANHRLQLKPLVWFSLWAFLGWAICLWQPSHGPALVLASLPFSLWLLTKTLRNKQIIFAWQGIRNFSISLVVKYAVLATAILIVINLIMCFTPFGSISHGLIKFLLENAKVNASAYGINWYLSLTPNILHSRLQDFSYPQTSLAIIHFLWQLKFTSAATSINVQGLLTSPIIWLVLDLVGLFVAFYAGNLLLQELISKRTVRLPILWLTTLLCLFPLLMMPYSFGRIDPSYISRPGTTSHALLLVATVLTYLYCTEKINLAKFIIISTSFLGIFGFFFSAGANLPSLRNLLQLPMQTLMVTPQQYAFEGNQINLPKLGKLFLSTERLNDLINLRKNLDNLLKKDETYLDLTNKDINYFYLNYPVPVLETNFYNAPATKTQQRMIKQLKDNPPPVVLAYDNNITLDGGTAALRAYLLYRYVVLHYIPITLNSQIFLVTPNRISEKTTDKAQDLLLLDQAFLNADLQALPLAWGLSWSTLSPQLNSQGEITPDKAIAKTGLIKNNDGSYSLTAAQGQLTYDLSTLKLSGQTTGFISFSINCINQPQGKTEIGINWQSTDIPSSNQAAVFNLLGYSNRLLAIPVDTSPRWLLSNNITQLNLMIFNNSSCQTFTVSNLSFWGRKL